MGDIGVNPGQAVSTGGNAEQTAGDYDSVASALRGAVESARTAAVEQPCAKGYDPFGEDAVSAINDLKKHGMTLGNNSQSGGGAASQTDHDNATGFHGIIGLMNR
ncbi:hypothetical protein [Saccharopolyspora sp. NPDC002376]